MSWVCGDTKGFPRRNSRSPESCGSSQVDCIRCLTSQYLNDTSHMEFNFAETKCIFRILSHNVVRKFNSAVQLNNNAGLAEFMGSF